MTPKESTDKRRTIGRWIQTGLLVWILLILALFVIAFRTATVTDYLYTRLVKDPPRTPPPGQNIVAPADGHIIYIKEVKGGEIPLVIKNRTPIPIGEIVRVPEGDAPKGGLLIGIFMNVHSVHLGRIPMRAKLLRRHWYNGPHLNMSQFERRLILSHMLPSWTALKRLFDLTYEPMLNDADYITRSAREILVFEGDFTFYTVRIADYYVGEILTWIETGQSYEKGKKFGTITWGSQTDLFIENNSAYELKTAADVGDYVYGGETILATY